MSGPKLLSKFLFSVAFICERSLADQLSFDESTIKYSSSWAIELEFSNSPEYDVKVIADSLGLRYRQLYGQFYILADKYQSNSGYEARDDITDALTAIKKVVSAKQQVFEEYSPRSLLPSDPNWPHQWYLRNGTKKISHRVEDVWKEGFTGEGVTVVVIDNGLRHTHEDLKDNYNATVSHDIIPIGNSSDARHGTNCAGIIASTRGNGICGVGAAYKSKIGGIRLFEKDLATDVDEAAAFFPPTAKQIHIFSCSFGPKDIGNVIRGPKEFAANALKQGVTKGRNSLGSIYVFSSGNGGIPFGDSCAFDGYVNSIYTIAVSGIEASGNIPSFAEPCGAIMTTVYSGNLVTTDIGSDTDCRNDFGATSAAAALVSGIIALALEANPYLSWRDVQHLIARSSKQDEVIDTNLVTNKAHFTVSQYFGFGVLDAHILVKNAMNWTGNVPSQVKCEIRYRGGKERIPASITLEVTNSSCGDVIIKSLEHVQMRVTLVYKPRGFLAADVTSPSNTTSRFLHRRDVDAITGTTDYTDLVTTSVHFWGEASLGEWTISIFNSHPTETGNGSLFNVDLILYGTTTHVSNAGGNAGRNNTNGGNGGGGGGGGGDGSGGKDPTKELKPWIIVVIVIVSVSTITPVPVYFMYKSRARRSQRDAVFPNMNNPDEGAQLGENNMATPV